MIMGKGRVVDRVEKGIPVGNRRFIGTLVLGLLFSLALSFGVMHNRWQEQQNEFLHDARGAMRDYTQALLRGGELLANFGLLFESSAFVSEEEFLGFVRPQMGVGDFVGVSFLALSAQDNPYSVFPDEERPAIDVVQGERSYRFVYRYMVHSEQGVEQSVPVMHLMHSVGDNYRQMLPRAIASGEAVLAGVVSLQRKNDTLVFYQPVYRQQRSERQLLGMLAVLVNPLAALERVQRSHRMDAQLLVEGLFVGESSWGELTEGKRFTLQHEEGLELKGSSLQLVYSRDMGWLDLGIKGAVVAFLLGILLTFFAYRLREAGEARLRLLQERNRVIRRKVDEQTLAVRQSNAELRQQKAALDEHAIVSIADPGGSITYVNDRFCSISGYPREELLGRNHRLIKSDYHPPEFFAEMWETISAGRVWHGDICNLTKSGEEYWVHSTIVPFINERGEPYQYVSIRTEFTELKRVTEGLQAREQELDTILNTVPALIWFKDREGYILRINRQAASLLGHTPEQMIGRTMYEFFPEDAERYRATDLQVMQSGEPLLGQMEEKELAGGHYHIRLDRMPYRNPQGEVIGMVTMATDMTKQVQMKAELLANEERLRRSQTFANIGTWDWSIQSGELFWSERIAPLFGYEVGELETTYENFLNAVHPEDRELVTSAVAACVEHGAEYNIEHRVVWPDGTVRWLSEKGDVVRDEDGTPLHMLGVVSDIHDRKMAEQALKESEDELSESEEKFRSLYEMSPVGIALNEMDGTFIEANQAFLDIVGYSGEECRALTYWELTPEEYAPQEAEQLQSLATLGRYGPYEKEYIHRDGHRVDVLLNGTIIRDREGNRRIWSIVQDITERKQAERQLNRFKTTLDVTQDCVFMFDPWQLRFTYVNQGAVEQIGYSKQELLQMHPYDIKPDYDEAAFRELVEPLIEGGGGSLTFDTTHRHRSGEMIPVEIVLQYIAPADETPRFVAIVRNIGERKQMQQKLVEAKEQAEQANKAKSEFLSSMSHELRTPLNAIIGFTQLIEGDENLTAEQRESLHDISSAGTHLLELINDVLDLAKIEAGKMELSISGVAVSDVMAVAKNLISPLAEKSGLTLNFSDACSSGYVVYADFIRIKQVLLNLLSNAVKYNRENGTIDVDCREQQNGRMRISVGDSGKGIPESKRQGLFEAFNRLDAEGGNIEGTGIGLVITRQLVELMGGTIGVESVEGEGTTFWFELPSTEPGEESEVSHPVDSVSQDGRLGAGRSVLYIEDNPVNLKLVTQLIAKRTALRMLSAEEPLSGIAMAIEHCPDLILLDINLPEMSGYEVLRHLRDKSETRDIPVIALSANAMASDLERGKTAGFDGYLTKPLNMREFLAELERHLG